ncbi:MAG: hypothetical protein P8M22_06920 [Phycisphaerales bacterium]|nr:hypothetical protein [Phycisphaerales bacterium]
MHFSIQMIGRGLAPLLLGAALCTTPAVVHAEEASPLPAVTTNGEVIFDVNFPGGSLSEFASLLQSKDSSSNIFVQHGAADFPVPALSMRKVSVSACVWMLDLLTTTNEAGVFRDISADSYYIPGQSHLYVLSSMESRPARPTQKRVGSNGRGRTQRASTGEPSSTIHIDTMSVGELLSSGFTKDMILNGIGTLQSLESEQGTPAKAIIEEDSGIIMVKGTSDQIHRIWELLSAMDDSTYYRKAVLEAQSQPAEANSKVALKLLTELQLAEMSRAELQDRLVKISQLRKDARGNDAFQSQLNDQFLLTMARLKSIQEAD